MLSTDGGVAFVGDYDRVSARWSQDRQDAVADPRSAHTVQGYPVSFSVDGKQYIAITTGLGGGSPEQSRPILLGDVHHPDHGQALYVFALPETN